MLRVQVSVPRCCVWCSYQRSTMLSLFCALKFEMQHISSYECYEMVDLQYEISRMVWCFLGIFSCVLKVLDIEPHPIANHKNAAYIRTSSDSIWFFQQREWLNVDHSIQWLWILDYKLTMSYLMLKACYIEEISASGYAPESSLAICSDFCCENRL